MFLLEIPTLELIGDEDEEDFIKSKAWINPLQISSVTLAEEESSQCVLTMNNQEWFAVDLSIDKFQALINEFLEDSLVTKIYKNKKDKQ
jgi:hypothetical protein